MIEVLAPVPYPLRRVAGQRYRSEQWAPLLERHGVRVGFAPFLGRGGMDLLYRPGHAWAKVGQVTVPQLVALAPALRRLRGCVDFELRVIGGTVAIEGVDVRCVPWSVDREVEDLRPLDVGLMPLPDDEWSRGKCGMKALQYMALGTPAVVSPVGANRDIVQDGVNGFHARTDEEWVDRLAQLLRDPELRARLGTAARLTVERGYSAEVHVPRLARVLKEAAA